MLQLHINETERYDRKKQEFVTFPEFDLQLEHSLVSISKWESIWNKPFLSDKKQKTAEELKSYIKCMTLTQKVPSYVYDVLTKGHLEQIRAYIDAPMSATFFRKKKNQAPPKEAMTSELIYYMMFANDIPIECQKWHLNRLLTLIHLCSIKNNPKKKKGKNDEREILRDYAAINAKRRAEAAARTGNVE